MEKYLNENYHTEKFYKHDTCKVSLKSNKYLVRSKKHKSNITCSEWSNQYLELLQWCFTIQEVLLANNFQDIVINMSNRAVMPLAYCIVNYHLWAFLYMWLNQELCLQTELKYSINFESSVAFYFATLANSSEGYRF